METIQKGIELFNQFIAWLNQNWTFILPSLVAAGIFYLVMKFILFIMKFSTSRFLSFSKRNRLERLQSELLKYQALQSKNDAYSAFLFSTIIIGALNNFSKAAISICLGGIFSQFVPKFLLIGLIFALYYLIMAAFTVKGTDSKIDAKARTYKLLSKIRAIEDKLNK